MAHVPQPVQWTPSPRWEETSHDASNIPHLPVIVAKPDFKASSSPGKINPYSALAHADALLYCTLHPVCETECILKLSETRSLTLAFVHSALSGELVILLITSLVLVEYNFLDQFDVHTWLRNPILVHQARL
jgi:hypothetical protein